MKLPATAVALVAAAAILGGCAYAEPYAMSDLSHHAQRIEYGVVDRIDLFRDGQSAPSGLGAILGGVAGGVIGHQFGDGFGSLFVTEDGNGTIWRVTYQGSARSR